MTTPMDNLDELLACVAEGRLDDLTPEQVAALEEHLNAMPAAAERLAGIVPAAEPQLRDTAAPSAAEWNDVWERIESATAPGETRSRVIGRAAWLWRTVTAAAACLLLVVVWRIGASATEPAWEIQLSDHVLVHELEVFGDASSFVAYAEDGSGSAVIWVFEEDQQQPGA
jgi:hypothetical protein